MRLWLAALCAGLAACAPGPDYAQPEVEVPDGYLTALAQTGAPSVDLWWQGFSDARLDGFVETAFEDNLNLEAAAARLDAARNAVRSATSDFFPVVDGLGTGRAQEDLGGGGALSASAGLSGFWVPDINGRLRRQLEQARALSARAGYTLLDARRLVAAAVAASYVEVQRTRARLALLDQSLELQNQTLDIVKARKRAGLSAALDVERAAADLARTRAQRGLLSLAEARARNGLALLLGRAPSALVWTGESTADIPRFGVDADIGIPADLIRRRPDVLAAEATLMAATAAIGIQQADLYPSLRLPGSLTAALGESGSVFSSGVALITATLDVPLLDAGRRRAEVRAARAQARAALADYEATLLGSLRDAETALVAVESFRARQTDLAIAVSSSEAAFDQLNALYKEGLATFIDILDVQRSLIASREAYVDVEAALAQSYIDLFSATGAPTRRVDAR